MSLADVTKGSVCGSPGVALVLKGSRQIQSKAEFVGSAFLRGA